MLAASFSRWLGQQAVSVRRVCAEHQVQYLRFRARRVHVRRQDATTLGQFLEFLRHEGLIPAEEKVPRRLTPVERETQAFETYLRNERVLADATIAYYVPFTRRFLTDRFGNGPVTLSRVCAADVVRFVQRQAARLHVKRAKQLTTALRSFPHYARYRGEVTLDLAAAVPIVANWSMSAIPRAISADAVRRLLVSISRRTPVGRRDYAILLVLARLGLRASELVRLELDDIDWDAGQISIRGKAGYLTALPLPADVGKAIAAYLRHGRPPSSCRRVFIRGRAPLRGFQGPSAVGCVVRRAIVRAGVSAPTRGAHQFRHGLATQMLRHGASLTEIGEVLRHRSPETTKIYTKVDLEALRTLALPWPGGGR
jgi:integrase/recombinase XerD